MNYPLLEVKNLSKMFGNLDALSHISFQMEKGEVLGIVGQRGSGKTLLFNLLFGLDQPTGGEILVENKKVAINSPETANGYGINAVLSPPLLNPNLNIPRNIFLGKEIRWPLKNGPFIDYQSMASKSREFLKYFDLDEGFILKKTKDISIEEKTIVSLAHALIFSPRILLLDDTLANLNYSRQQQMLGMLRELSAKDVSVIISSDDLKSLFSITDRILVFFNGSIIAQKSTRDSTPKEIIELMVGTDVKERITPVIWAMENYHAIQQEVEKLYISKKYLEKDLAFQGDLNVELFQRLEEKISAAEQLTAALQSANMRIMAEKEEERKNIARELHDQTIQDLLSFIYRVDNLIAEECDDSNHMEGLNFLSDGLQRIVVGLRRLCSDLRPPTIDNLGLPAAIRSLIKEWSERNPSIAIKVDIDDGLGRFSEPIELSIFRIVQEGLNNIAKHSNAKNIELKIRRTSNSSIKLTLIDNGKGFDGPIDLVRLSSQKHFGLLGISERVALLGGEFNINSPAGGGTELNIQIMNPYP